MPRSAGSRTSRCAGTRPLVLPPEATVADAARLLPADRGPRHRRRATRRRPPIDRRRARRRPGHPARHRAARRAARATSRAARTPSIDADDVDSAAPRVRPHRRRRRRDGLRAAPRLRRRHAHRAAARCARRCTGPRVDASGRLQSWPRRSASTATSPPRRSALAAAGVDVLVVDTAHGHQEGMLRALRTVVGPGPRHADRGRQHRHRRGRARPRRAGRRHPQGRRRPRRDVHDAHDDRGRAPAVLRRARDGRGGARCWARTSGPTAACATRATSRSRSPRARHPS